SLFGSYAPSVSITSFTLNIPKVSNMAPSTAELKSGDSSYGSFTRLRICDGSIVPAYVEATPREVTNAAPLIMPARRTITFVRVLLYHCFIYFPTFLSQSYNRRPTPLSDTWDLSG